MTERDRFIKALKREQPEDRCPTFELEFFLTLEAVGKIHPSQLKLDRWNQMEKEEQLLHLEYIADTHIEVAEKYHHSAIFLHPPRWRYDSIVSLLDVIREKTGDKYFLMIHGDPTFCIPDGESMMKLSERMYDDENGLKDEAQKSVEKWVSLAEKLSKRSGLLDGFALCSDYCFNSNPFFSPDMFSVYIAPYLQQTIESYRSMGYYTIKHSDGNIMPIADQLVQCRPDALHSLDPQGGIDLNEMKRLYGDKVALCGNVNCGLLQTGSEDEVVADVRRSLREGMKDGGYIFCTSNCVYTGLPLERYELMNSIWQREGTYSK